MIITHPTLTITEQNATGGGIHQFFADASDLGLKPGEWPQAIRTTLGNGLFFIRTGYDRVGGDLHSVTYAQANGCIEITIYND